MAELQVVAQEVAEQEFARFLVAMDLVAKTDETKMSEEDRKSFADTKAEIITAMMRGTLTIDEPGQAVFKPVKTECDPIVFFEPRGSELQAMDGVKRGNDVERQNKLLGAITRQPPVLFAKMFLRDYRVCKALLALFLA